MWSQWKIAKGMMCFTCFTKGFLCTVPHVHFPSFTADSCNTSSLNSENSLEDLWCGHCPYCSGYYERCCLVQLCGLRVSRWTFHKSHSEDPLSTVTCNGDFSLLQNCNEGHITYFKVCESLEITAVINRLQNQPSSSLPQPVSWALNMYWQPIMSLPSRGTGKFCPQEAAPKVSSCVPIWREEKAILNLWGWWVHCFFNISSLINPSPPITFSEKIIWYSGRKEVFGWQERFSTPPNLSK